MSTKKSSKAVAVVPVPKPADRLFGGELVRVDAVYRNPPARPGKGGPWD